MVHYFGNQYHRNYRAPMFIFDSFSKFKQDNRRFPNLSVRMLLMFTNKAVYYTDIKGQALLLSHLIGQADTCMDKMCPS